MANDDFTNIKAAEIVQLLSEPIDDRRPLKQSLQKFAPVKELKVALQISQVELTCRILCDILGARKAKTAVPVLLECLDDPSPWVKDDAAEALGKIESIKAGRALLDHFKNNPRLWYAVALGAIGYRLAIPYLIDARSNPSAKVRGGSAWALGELLAIEAEKTLEAALAYEEDESAMDRIHEALNRIQENKGTS